MINNRSDLSFAITNISMEGQGDAADNTGRQADFRIIWITAGHGVITVDLQQFTYAPQQLFFVRAGQLISWKPDTGPQGFVLSFSAGFIHNSEPEFNEAFYGLLQQLLSDVKINSSDAAETPEMEDILLKMEKEYLGNNSWKTELLKRYLKIFLIHLSRLLENRMELPQIHRNGELLQKFMALLEKHYLTEKMVTAYADMLAVTPNYLNMVIKRCTGYPASYHIRQRVVLEAKRRAAHSDLNMKEIAYFLGFYDTSHFSKFFKSATGMNFTEFKKELIYFNATAVA
ncbi:AraC family transcriptional regulator [Chitinophaga sp. sic0106]|uniref:AraC family transcriptional regulator n=1 Tax=Chitinophaga sp. sic0106 TaxID=2854785 RepID=UPI001C47E481|nr:helix-turn-helix transcriptional regulator [Chitinophaga sp. sic0106]MBV7532564.1 helix-turn-helix transcriptional regulator [Chitinophaga sp. sic0106]